MVVRRLYLRSSLKEADKAAAVYTLPFFSCFLMLLPILISVQKTSISDGGYKKGNQSAIHFITFAVVEWVDVFTRKEYRNIILESIRYCQNKRELLLHAWCIMSNHLRLVTSAKKNDLSDVLRDFKKFTSKQIAAAIEANQHESRRDWMLRIFKEESQKNSRNNNYQFWRQSLSRTMRE